MFFILPFGHIGLLTPASHVRSPASDLSQPSHLRRSARPTRWQMSFGVGFAKRSLSETSTLTAETTPPSRQLKPDRSVRILPILYFGASDTMVPNSRPGHPAAIAKKMTLTPKPRVFLRRGSLCYQMQTMLIPHCPFSSWYPPVPKLA